MVSCFWVPIMGLMFVFRCNVVMIMGLMFVDLMILSLMIMGLMLCYVFQMMLRVRWTIEGSSSDEVRNRRKEGEKQCSLAARAEAEMK